MGTSKDGSDISLFSSSSRKKLVLSGKRGSGRDAGPKPLGRVRLKRSRKKHGVLALGLVGLAFLLSLVSLHKYFTVERIAAVVSEPAAAEDASASAEALPLNLAAWESGPLLHGESEAAGHGAPETGAGGEAQDPVRTQRHHVESGDTATSLLADYLSPSDIHLLSRECRDVHPLRKIKTGHEYRLRFRGERLIGFEYDIDTESKLSVAIEDGGFRASKEAIDYTTRKKLVQGRIETSLFEAVEEAGGTAALAISLSQIFAWDIDFIRDVREGDSFRFLVAERYRHDEFVGYGRIQAARFVNQGEEYNAFLYRTAQGRREYFNAEGQALRKTFLKAPLNFTRISSGYTWKRKHPILDKVRPHLGIDYAAPRGTPIKSVAKGEVIKRSYAHGAGNYLKIRHPNHYVTVYNHMTSFASGTRPGTEVEQGEVIGYVGSTGLSTGPHLDYRVKRYGKYQNPRKIESEPVKSVAGSEMSAFREAIQPLRAALDSGETELAVLSSERGS